MKKIFGIFFIALIVLAACDMKPMQVRAPLVGEGEVFIYLEPFPQEAERLRFSLDGVSAVKEDGTSVPLALSFQEFRPGELKRQRLVASGRLPQGSYSGLSFSVKRALLKGEEGEADLMVPKEPVKGNFLFSAASGKALVISMTFRYSDSVRGGFNFIPSFSLSVPGRPLITLKAFVPNRGSDSVTVLDKRSGRVAAVIATGSGPSGAVLDQKARRAYVVLSEDDSIEVIDADRGEAINRMRLNTGDRPQELVLTPDGSTLLTANRGSDSVSFVNPFNLVEQKRLTVGDGPSSVLLDRTGRKGFVFNSLSNTISVVDIPNKTVASTIVTEQGPLRGQFNRRGDRLFVFYERSPYLVVFDPSTFNVVRRIFVGAGVSSLKVDVNNDLLYLARRHDGIIEVYDPFSIMPIETFSVGGGVSYMTIDNEGNNLCVVLPEKKRLVLVNLISRKITEEIDVGDNPYWVVMMGER